MYIVVWYSVMVLGSYVHVHVVGAQSVMWLCVVCGWRGLDCANVEEIGR